MNALRSLLVCVLLLAACATPPREAAAPPPVLILVSIDGFRTDYIDRGLTPTLSSLAEGGVRADAMRPSFPSVTFPNHYTLVTGLRPDRHGIVNNTMVDPTRPDAVFKLSDRVEATNPFWWEGAAPLWVTAEAKGVRTATMFWPGSEVAIRGVRPRDWLPFNQAMPSQARVDQVLAWMERPAQERPRFVTLYFDIVDTQGHVFGPDSAEVNAALGEVDAAMASLVAGLKARGVAADLVVVSDHGMAAVGPERSIDLDALVAPDAITVPWMAGYLLGVTPVAGREAAVEAALLGRRGPMECWRKRELPERFAFGASPRIPPIVCLPDTGWTIVSAARPSRYASKGAHGYDPQHPDMGAVFVANGPSFRAGARVPPFDNVHVYPLLTHILGVAPEPNDGDLAVLKPALRP
ncbi:MAG: ectonucleotide pyrophosphatase/phosphodiesterase [Hyphomonadaceae bacterium]|nr:ectonucleotide pyrophosphatase/phosphodiesterase [Hyphomonadaceae bacterium]